MGIVLGKISVETPKHTVVASGPDYEIREYGANIVAEVSYDRAEGTGAGFTILANYIGAFGKPQNVKGEQKGETIAMTAPVLTAQGGGQGETIAMTAPVLTAQGGGQGEKIAMTAPVLTAEGGGQGEKIAMTAPVLTAQGGGQGEKIAMTAPVLTEDSPSDVEGNKGPMVMQFVLPSKFKCLEDVPCPKDSRVRIKEVSPRKYGVIKFNGVASDQLVEKKVARLRQVLQEAGYKVIGQHTLAQYNPPFTIPWLRTNEVMLPVE